MVRVDPRVSLVPLGRPLRGGAVVPGGVQPLGLGRGVGVQGLPFAGPQDQGRVARSVQAVALESGRFASLVQRPAVWGPVPPRPVAVEAGVALVG